MAQQLPSSGIVGDPQRLLIELASLHKFTELLPLAVQRLSESSAVALVSIWLTQPPLPKDFSACRLASECSNRDRCLHLEEFSGRSISDTSANWQRLDGAFRRFRIGVRKVGQIAATGQSLEIANVEQDHDWVATPDWIAA